MRKTLFVLALAAACGRDERSGIEGTGTLEVIEVDVAPLTPARVVRVWRNEGDTVRAGQFVARVGNNGYGRSPHIHVGAWKGQTPYQIRWDLRRPAAAQ